MTLTQRRLDEALIKLARHNGYDEGFWGTTLEHSHLSPDLLLELREEMRLVTTSEEDQPIISNLIFQPPPHLYNIHFTPAT
jgi:hypothetical protein